MVPDMDSEEFDLLFLKFDNRFNYYTLGNKNHIFPHANLLNRLEDGEYWKPSTNFH